MKQLRQMGEKYETAYIQQKICEDEGVLDVIKLNKMQLQHQQRQTSIGMDDIQQSITNYDDHVNHLNEVIKSRIEEFDLYHEKKLKKIKEFNITKNYKSKDGNTCFLCSKGLTCQKHNKNLKKSWSSIIN